MAPLSPLPYILGKTLPYLVISFVSAIMVILSAMLVSSAIAGLMSQEYARVLLWALPGAIAGTFIGARVYRRLDDHRFDRLVMLLLLVAGGVLVVSSQA